MIRSERPQKDQPHLVAAGAGYGVVAQAIDFLVRNADAAPDLETLAANAGLSPQHFQRVFRAGAGVSPKRFLQVLAAEAGKRSLDAGASVLEASLAAGLSGPSRLHDVFLVAEAMTPGDYRRRGEGLTVRFAIADGPMGQALIGATDRGVCWLGFTNGDACEQAIAAMTAEWPAARFTEDPRFIAPLAERAFAFARGDRLTQPIGLHVQGSNFQIKVWEALLSIPPGVCVTYGRIAEAVCSKRASRAVGAAVGSNPVSVLIPCHRVILSSGATHNYRWGAGRKRVLLAAELAREPTAAG